MNEAAEALLRRYKPRRAAAALTMGPALARGLELLVPLEAALTSPGWSEPPTGAGPDARTLLFRVEGYLRLYAPLLGERGTRALATVKELEDQLGEVSLRRELCRIQRHPTLERERARAERGLLRVGKAWTPKGRRGQVPSLDLVIEALVRGELPRRAATDRQFLRRRLRGYVENLRDEAERWDFALPRSDATLAELEVPLQDVVHEARRDLRWLPIFLKSLGGALQLNPKPTRSSSEFLKADPPPPGVEPIVLSRRYFSQLSATVDRLGRLKDAGERAWFLDAATRPRAIAKSSKGKAPRPGAAPCAEVLLKVLEDARRVLVAFRRGGALAGLIAELKTR